nr:MAG TPA_asm: hypothetical protein [Caudoviricetes sp.]
MLNFFTFYILQIFITHNNAKCFYQVFHHLCCFSSALITCPLAGGNQGTSRYGEDLLTSSNPLLLRAFVTPYQLLHYTPV